MLSVNDKWDIVYLITHVMPKTLHDFGTPMEQYKEISRILAENDFDIVKWENKGVE